MRAFDSRRPHDQTEHALATRELERVLRLHHPARVDRRTAGGYRGFSSKEAYEAHYSCPASYASELPAMETYAREAEEERAT